MTVRIIAARDIAAAADLQRTNVAFMRLPLSAEEHRVQLTFESLLWGAALTIAYASAGAFSLLLARLWLGRGRTIGSAPSTPPSRE